MPMYQLPKLAILKMNRRNFGHFPFLSIIQVLGCNSYKAEMFLLKIEHEMFGLLYVKNKL